MSDGKKPDNDNDVDLFRAAMADVTPIKATDQYQHSPSRPRPQRRSRHADDGGSSLSDPYVDKGLSDTLAPDEVDHNQFLLFVRDGMQPSQLRRLKKGQVSINDELDLHGYNVDEARWELAAFLNHSGEQNFRCLRVIHGKGYGTDARRPVLKSMVNHWLRQRDDVLAFCSAQPKDGGTGALYVLLRSKR